MLAYSCPLLADHFKPSTVRRLHQERPSLRWGCCEWMVGPLLNAGVDKRLIDVFSLDSRQVYVDLSNTTGIVSVPLLHNVPNCGYRIFRYESGEKLFYATDCSTLAGIEAKNYELYLIEANHERAEIEARIEAKRAAGEYAYEMEAMRNHQSREDAEAWLAENAGPNSRYVFLHVHQTRQTPPA